MADKQTIAPRALSDLSQDEFFDAFGALSPMIPAILDTEYVRLKMFHQLNESMKKAGLDIAMETAKAKPDSDKLARANENMVNETTGMIARDISALFPVITDRKHRDALREAVAVICGVTADEVKAVGPMALKDIVMQILKDPDVQSFLAFAESPERTG